MIYQFDFRPYQRRFTRPLTTNHGTWDIREGIIICLWDEIGTIGWGEIAPISWFGSETLQQALDFCRQLPREITQEMIFSIPDALPACQFGFESAWEMGRWGEGEMGRWGEGEEGEEGGEGGDNSLLTRNSSLSYSCLLPPGEAALEVWENLWEEGYRTFKWKIGVGAIAYELEVLQTLAQKLPTSGKLRLDANGGLSYEEAEIWLKGCDRLPVEIEFLEQPLPVGEFQGMLKLSSSYQTAIALDESVATLKQLINSYYQGWRGIFVVKPGIAGSLSRLREFCRNHEIDVVFSSVMETAIGRQAALQLAVELSATNRAVGFGINHWFTEDEESWLKNLWNGF
ncbi:MAG: o-succinylbenzoate synthase [Nostocaceae cyanobacterium]|nr:o-succinylbenzoate synthase [Nostocaceae cyanobacterium]